MKIFGNLCQGAYGRIMSSQHIFKWERQRSHKQIHLSSDNNSWNKKYVLSNSESVQCNFFIFDHVMKIGWFFTEIWWYIDFQNGGRPPSWNCFTTIRDHRRSLFCWPQLPVKFHVYLTYRSDDIAVWIFRIFGLKCLFSIQVPKQVPKMGVLGDFGPITVIIHHRDPQKAHPCVNPHLLSYQLKKICWGVWPVGELTESVTDTHTDRHHTHR